MPAPRPVFVFQTATVDQVGDTAAGTHHYPDDGGVYTVTVTILADGVTTAVDSRVITVTNVDPTLTVPANQTINEGSLLSLTDIGQFIDPGFDNPTGTPPTEENFTYSIDWGDGSSVDSGAATTDTTGSAGVLTAGSFDGSHTYADNGTYTVSVTVTDDDGGADTETFDVTVGNVDPTLVVPSNQTVDEGTLLVLKDIAMFTDPGFDNAAATPATAETFTVSVDWGDGTTADSGSATIDTPGSSGSLTAGSFDGSHTYADNGTYTVSVTVADDDGGADTETFDVTVGNVDPTLVVLGNQTIDEGSLLSLTNIGTFTDLGFNNPSGTPATVETFTYSINWGDGSAADTGSATTDTVGSAGVLTGGSFDGSHTYGDNGVYTVTVTVNDDDGGFDTETLVVTVDNAVPAVAAGADQTASEGDSVAIAPTFSDPGALDTHTATIDWGDGSSLESIDPATSPIAGSHIYADNGTYTVTVTVTDDDGEVDSDTIAVTVNNDDPTLTVSANQTIDEGTLLSLTNIGSFTDPGFDNPAATPPTVETFTYSINWGDGTAADTGTATIDTAGSAGVLTAGSFDGTHTYAADGVYTVSVTVTDDDGGVDTETFAVTVNKVDSTLTGFGVNDERENRSAVKTVDLAFNDIDFIGDLLNSLGDGDVETDRVRIERLDLAGNAIGAGEFLSLPAAAFVQNGLKLSIGFGAAGLQQNGVYAVRVDMDGNLSNGFEEARRFHRLLGDVNGDGKVDRTDLAKTRAAYRRPGRYSDADVDGDGDVDRFDLRIYSTLARTRYRDRLLFDRHELDD